MGRDARHHCCSQCPWISIHSPRVGRDSPATLDGRVYRHFNPLAPCGARREELGQPAGAVRISIHSPRVGRDIPHMLPFLPQSYFNPLAPCGARRRSRDFERLHQYFNPLAPCGARRQGYRELTRRSISIHSPRVGRDGRRQALSLFYRDFNPLAPCGARQPWDAVLIGVIRISIHSPRVGRDIGGVARYGFLGISIHSPRVGRDPICTNLILKSFVMDVFSFAFPLAVLGLIVQ